MVKPTAVKPVLAVTRQAKVAVTALASAAASLVDQLVLHPTSLMEGIEGA